MTARAEPPGRAPEAANGGSGKDRKPPNSPEQPKKQADQLAALRATFGSTLVDDAKFLARLLKSSPQRATLGRLGIRPCDWTYREVLDRLVAMEQRP